MPSSSTRSVINQVKFRVARAEKAWNETLELLRAAAAAPG
jgi:hypothetical protein